MNNTLNTTAALSVARLRTFMTFAAITFGLASCGKEEICTDSFAVIAPEALEQPLTTNSDGVPFESYEEAESYLAFILNTDSTAYVSTTTNCE